jgi:hypothetical protein
LRVRISERHRQLAFLRRGFTQAPR